MAHLTHLSGGRSVKRNTWERMCRIYGWLKNGEYPNCPLTEHFPPKPVQLCCGNHRSRIIQPAGTFAGSLTEWQMTKKPCAAVSYHQKMTVPPMTGIGRIARLPRLLL